MDKKKKVAAVSAVLQYIKSEEEMMMAQAAAGAGMTAPVAAAPINLWGISGRQHMMQMQNMFQLRTFRGGRLR